MRHRRHRKRRLPWRPRPFYLEESLTEPFYALFSRSQNALSFSEHHSRSRSEAPYSSALVADLEDLSRALEEVWSLQSSWY